jgi:hypothetical protein
MQFHQVAKGLQQRGVRMKRAWQPTSSETAGLRGSANLLDFIAKLGLPTSSPHIRRQRRLPVVSKKFNTHLSTTSIKTACQHVFQALAELRNASLAYV